MEKKTGSNPNIILIVIDALRARNLGCYGGEAESSPNIDSIAKKGILFEKCYSCWNTTDQSLTSIFSGRYPRTHGIVHHGNKIMPEDFKMFNSLNVKLLAEILQNMGYRTLAVDWMGRWFKNGFNYYGYKPERTLFRKIFYCIFTVPYVHVKYMLANIGLLKIYAKNRKSSVQSAWKGLKDVWSTFRFTFELARVQDANYVTSLAEELIKKEKNKNFFLFLHYWDTHSPYNCPKKFVSKSRRSRRAEDVLLSKYHGAVRYIDDSLGKLMAVLEREKLLDDTLIIITSDHGESLTEHGIYFDHHGLYDVTTHVPLIFYHPDAFPESKKIKGLIQHTDVVPTLCDLLSIKSKDFIFDGTSLLPLIRGEKEKIRSFAFSEESYVQRKIGIRTEKFKYIFAPDGVGMCNYCQKVHKGVEEFYNLEDDSHEAVNRFHDDKIEAGKLRKKLDDLLRGLETTKLKLINKGKKKGMSSKYGQNLKEEKKIKKKLQSLGYMD
ncbi:MAG: sulfatase [Candidatus Aminicenantaceae bacterium]